MFMIIYFRDLLFIEIIYLLFSYCKGEFNCFVVFVGVLVELVGRLFVVGWRFVVGVMRLRWRFLLVSLFGGCFWYCICVVTIVGEFSIVLL